MANIDLSQFKTLFNQTSLEYLKKMEDGIKILKENPHDRECINEMYIASHSLKSQSLLMGYASLGNTAYALEKIFRLAKENVSPLSSEVVQDVELVIHAIHACLTEIVNGSGEVDMSNTLLRFNKLLEEKM